MEEDDFCNESVRHLLQSAERRLRARGATASEVSKGSATPKLSKLNEGTLDKAYIRSTDGVAHTDPHRLLNDRDRRAADFSRNVEDPVLVRKRGIEERRATTGEQWFNLPRTDFTPELKRDLQLLKMRSTLDPKRHYKKEGARDTVPEFSQVGTILEGNTEYFSARIHNKERKRTFVEEILAGKRSTGRLKKKYDEVQVSKGSGKKGFYKHLKWKRSLGARKP